MEAYTVIILFFKVDSKYFYIFMNILSTIHHFKFIFAFNNLFLHLFLIVFFISKMTCKAHDMENV